MSSSYNVALKRLMSPGGDVARASSEIDDNVIGGAVAGETGFDLLLFCCFLKDSGPCGTICSWLFGGCGNGTDVVGGLS